MVLLGSPKIMEGPLKSSRITPLCAKSRLQISWYNMELFHTLEMHPLAKCGNLNEGVIIICKSAEWKKSGIESIITEPLVRRSYLDNLTE